MKKFITKTLFFLLPLLLLCIIIDFELSFLLRQNIKKYEGEFSVWNDIYNSNINCDIAIYGSSRAWVHIDPKILKDSLNMTAYNFGIDGHNFWLQYYRHIEFLKHNKTPKQIIVALDVISLEKRKDLYNYMQFLPYMLWNKDLFKYTNSYEGFNTIDYFIPLVRYFGKTSALNACIEVLLNKSDIEKVRINGFAGMDKFWNSDVDKALKEREEYKIPINEKSVELFIRFIEECKKRGIELIFVYTPEYIEGQKKYCTNRQEIIKIFEEISIKYDVTFYDYSGHNICLNKNLFYNASHLNKTGSELFTRQFAHDLLEARTHSNVYTK